MAVLEWKTGRPADEAVQIMKDQLVKTGYGDQVKWDDNTFKASIAMGFMLDVVGTVDEEKVTLEKCGGMSGEMVLGKLKKMFEYLFPGGERMAA